MSKEELSTITGGNVSASYLNALARGIESLYNLGKAFGTAMRMILKGKRC